MHLDPVLLSRIQFAFTVSFHIVFPSMSIGLAAFLVIVEALYLKKREEIYLRIYHFWSVLFALGFGMGVVSGIVMSFQFGTNFSRWAQAVGPVIGPVIGLEVVSAFFLEAGFLGIMLFGRERVGPKLHFFATCMVSLGTMISASCILVVNSWMQTPAGVALVDGRFAVLSWRHVIFNPSFPYRLIHMLLASWITASFLVAGVAAYYLLRLKHLEFAKITFSIGMGAASILLPTQLFLGDYLALKVVLPYQEPKLEAMEGFWDDAPRAPWNVIVVPDQKNQRNRFALSIPYLGSVLAGKNLHTTIPGLKHIPREKQPPMWTVFYGFRVMYILGTVMFCAALYSVYLRWRGRLFNSPVFLKLIVALLPSGFLCVLGGWFTAETGRQPYTVYGLMTTAQSISPVPASAVVASLISFVLVYCTLLCAYLALMYRTLRNGPAETESMNHPSGRRSYLRPQIAEGRTRDAQTPEVA